MLSSARSSRSRGLRRTGSGSSSGSDEFDLINILDDDAKTESEWLVGVQEESDVVMAQVKVNQEAFLCCILKWVESEQIL